MPQPELGDLAQRRHRASPGGRRPRAAGSPGAGRGRRRSSGRGSSGRRSRPGSPWHAPRRRPRARRSRAPRRPRRRARARRRPPPPPSRRRSRGGRGRGRRSITSSQPATQAIRSAPAAVARADLEVERPRAADRAGPEQGAAEIRARGSRRARRLASAAPRGARAPSRRPRRRRAPRSASRRPRHVQLVASRALERPPAVRPDLGLDRPACAAARMLAARPPPRRRRDGRRTRRCPRRWRLPAVWKSPDSSASRSQSRRGSIDASSRRTSSESDMLQLQQPALVLGCRGSRTSRSRRRRRPGGTGRTSGSRFRRRTFRPHAAHSGARRAPPARRT